MRYGELIQLYFERSNALQAYWTLYVVIVGGLLAFSSIRKHAAPLTTAIVTLLFALFAFKNLDAIHDVTLQRDAALRVITQADAGDLQARRDVIERTLVPASWGGAAATHIVSDVLTIAALWAMELRRKREPAP
ncbi:MAG: hypothetical protein M3154_12175 [Candidatus Eremiobacteraeota bacterium]|nr:hypothetical protein [Candidatus Eremiobacteraeota bacterium]